MALWLNLGRGSAGAACCAPTGYRYGNTRPGVESGSKLPHSIGFWRGSILRAAVEKIQ
jgi:hypothetical protein